MPATETPAAVTPERPAGHVPERPALAPFTLVCPHCAEQEASVSVLLNQLDCQQFRCEECNTEFSIEDMEAMIGRWQKVIQWVKSVPQFAAE